MTTQTGAFRLPGLLPGTYTVRVELTGFNTFERRNTVLNPAGNVSLPGLRLPVGQMTETITVEASGAQVEVENTDHSGILTSNQLAHIQTKGRDVTALLKLLPGVAWRGEPEAMGDSFGSHVPSISGQSREWNNYTVDGLNGNELSGTRQVASAVSLDAIGEVKVLLNTYKAEYGRTAGANIQVVTKSGGSEYDGNLYWYGRRTGWNANTWANNQNDVERPRYHFNTYGFNLGGPLPGQDGDKKLFFFYSLEAPRVERPGDLRYYSLPTELERRGDFSQSGVTIVDPLTGQPFPGNVIPPDRINRSVQNLFDLYPLPNTDPSTNPANANFLRQETSENPRMAHLLRLDWRPSAGDSFFLTARSFDSNQYGSEITAGPEDWGHFNAAYIFNDYSANVGWTKIINPNLVNELSVGLRRQGEGFQVKDDSDWDRITRSKVGWTEEPFFTGLDPQDTIPELIFGGKDNGGRDDPDFDFDTRLGETAYDWIGSVRNNLTWIKDVHTFKAGFNVERIHNNEARGGDFRGVFQFEHNRSNPLSTGDDYANALLGVFNSFTQASQQRTTTNRAWLAEWYVQDTWKASRRLTLDFGMRFLWFTPYHEADGSSASFIPSLYDPAKAPLVYAPAIVDGKRVAQSPADPADTKPANFIGSLVPGTGDFANGNVAQGTPGFPSGFKENQGIHPEPRVGVAYDVFGDGKTRLHASAGLFHQGVLGGGTQGNLGSNPPIMQVVRFTNGFISDLRGLEGTQPIGVVDVRGLEQDAKTPSSYNFSLGIERDIGFGTVVDVSYVGALGRHTEMEVDYNRKPDGADFIDLNPQNEDPIRPGERLPDNFLRPFQGYGRIRIHEYWGTTNYNGLQVQVNRRYSRGMQFGVAYTYSRAHTLDDNDDNAAPGSEPSGLVLLRPAVLEPDPQPDRELHRGRAQAQQGLGQRLRADGLRRVAVLGYVRLGQRRLGQPGPERLQPRRHRRGGSANGDRRPDPGGPHAVRGLARPERVREDPAGQLRQHGPAVLPVAAGQRPGPRGVQELPLSGDMNLQLRLEAYNVLNHTQIEEINNDLNFNNAGEQTNRNFGRAVEARDPRRLQASVRFTF